MTSSMSPAMNTILAFDSSITGIDALLLGISEDAHLLSISSNDDAL